jgi:hypothetical protein
LCSFGDEKAVRSKEEKKLTQDVAYPLISCLKEHQEILDQHPERQYSVLVSQIIVVKL